MLLIVSRQPSVKVFRQTRVVRAFRSSFLNSCSKNASSYLPKPPAKDLPGRASGGGAEARPQGFVQAGRRGQAQALHRSRRPLRAPPEPRCATASFSVAKLFFVYASQQSPLFHVTGYRPVCKLACVGSRNATAKRSFLIATSLTVVQTVCRCVNEALPHRPFFLPATVYSLQRGAVLAWFSSISVLEPFSCTTVSVFWCLWRIFGGTCYTTIST